MLEMGTTEERVVAQFSISLDVKFLRDARRVHVDCATSIK